MKDKEAKFFCEYCDAEVPRNARFCPKCGHFFLSVRCPECGYTGNQDDFTNGCPACGYAVGGGAKAAPSANGGSAGSAHSGRKKTLSTAKARNRARTEIDAIPWSGASKKRSDDPLPLWVYPLILCVFLVVFSVFLGAMR